jgi:hypothetical protein
LQLFFGNELGQHGQEGGRLEGGSRLDQENQDQQRQRSDQAGHAHHEQNDDQGHHEELSEDQQSAAIDDIGERTGRERKQEQRETGRRADQ